MTAAVLALARSELRRRWASLMVVAVVTAVAAAVALSALAGARRSATVTDRFVEATTTPDIRAYVLSDLVAAATADPSSATVDAVARQLRALDGVEAVGVAEMAEVELDAGGEIGLVASRDGSLGYEVERPLLIEGRMPAYAAAEEIAVSENAVAVLGLEVGDRVSARAWGPADLARLFSRQDPLEPPQSLELHVVGVVRPGEDLQGGVQSADPLAIASPSFLAEHQGRIGMDGVVVGLSHAQPERVTAAVQEILAPLAGPFGRVVISSIDAEYLGAYRSSVDVVVAALLTFSAGAALAGGAILWQLLYRHLTRSTADVRATAALGLTRRRRAVAAGLPLVGAAWSGVAVGVAGAFVLSSLYPPGLAGRAEPDPGRHLDPPGAGTAIALAIVFTAVILTTSWWQVGGVGHRPRPGPTRSDRLARAAATGGPTLTLGTRWAVQPSTARRAVPPRLAVLTAALALIGVIALVVFHHNLTATSSEPARWGWTWDRQFSTGMEPRDAARLLAPDDVFASVGVLSWGQVELAGQRVEAFAFEAAKGRGTPTLTNGRLPGAPDEIALGATTRRELGIEIGEAVRVTNLTGAAGGELRVVGEIVAPSAVDHRPGRGAVLTPEGLSRHVVTEPERWLLLSYRAGIDTAAADLYLGDRYELSVADGLQPEPPGRLVNLARVRPLNVALAGFLVAVAVFGLLHALVASANNRRTEHAVLQALGLTRRQLCVAVLVQALILGAAVLAVAAPLGVVTGRRSWLLVVDDLGMAIETSTPVRVLGLLVLIAASGVAVLGASAGFVVARRRLTSAIRVA